MAELSERNQIIKQLYDEGKSRDYAMTQCGVSNLNTRSSISNSMGLHWTWPLENRLSGIAPPKASLLPSSPRRYNKRRKDKSEHHTRVSPKSNLFKEPRTGSRKREVQERCDAVVVSPIEFDFSPQSLAPHLYKAPPHNPREDAA